MDFAALKKGSSNRHSIPLEPIKVESVGLPVMRVSVRVGAISAVAVLARVIAPAEDRLYKQETTTRQKKQPKDQQKHAV